MSGYDGSELDDLSEGAPGVVAGDAAEQPKMITIIDILRPEDPLRVPAEWVIRIPVRAPVWTTSDGRRVRIRSDAYVDVVRLPSGVVEIRGAYALAMEPGATNSIQVYLRDTLEPATADDEDRPRPKLRPGQEQTR